MFTGQIGITLMLSVKTGDYCSSTSTIEGNYQLGTSRPLIVDFAPTRSS
jgi:hypothetical protein